MVDQTKNQWYVVTVRYWKDKLLAEKVVTSMYLPTSARFTDWWKAQYPEKRLYDTKHHVIRLEEHCGVTEADPLIRLYETRLAEAEGKLTELALRLLEVNDEGEIQWRK